MSKVWMFHLRDNFYAMQAWSAKTKKEAKQMVRN